MSNQPWKISAPTNLLTGIYEGKTGVSGVRLDMFDTVHVMCQSRARCVTLIHPTTGRSHSTAHHLQHRETHFNTVGQNILGLKSSTYLILQQFEGIMACVVYNCYLWPGSGPVNKQIYRDNNWGARLTVVC